MTILHAVWSTDSHLQVWGEQPLRGARLPRPRGRAPAGNRPRRHPYATRVEDLRDRLGELTRLDLVHRLASTEATLVLPSGGHAPQPSPELPGGAVAPTVPGGLRAWRVDALALAGQDALALLLALPAEPPVHARPGASLRSAATLAGLALELAARGRVVPGLVRRDHGMEARWLPLLDRAERRRLEPLVAALPPALLAAADARRRAPGTVLRGLLEQLIDAAARSALAGPPLEPSRGASVEQRWLRALIEDDPSVSHPDPAALELLTEELDAWHRSGERPAPLRAVFRLRPPDEPALEEAGDGQLVDDETPQSDLGETGDGQDTTDTTPTTAQVTPHAREPWRLEFALRATDDPSLLITAEDIWAREETARFLDRTLEPPEERLLEDLGRAVRLYPTLSDALATARPKGLDLDVDEVVAFLRDTAPVLEQAGFGLLLPDELRRPARLGARLRTTTPSSEAAASDPAVSSGLLGHEGIVDFHWEVAVGDAHLDAEELYDLARLKAPLVRLRGRWVELSESDLDAAVHLLEQAPSGRMSVAEAARIGLGVDEPDIGLDVAGVDADGALAALLDADGEQRLETLTTPTGLRGTLRPYQERGLSWLAFLDAVGLGGCLADDMGLGKSIQLLALLVREREGRTRRSDHWPAPTLLICPMTIVGNWEREATRFAPDLVVHVHHGADRPAGEELIDTARGADLVLTTYQLAARDRDELATVDWGRIALDEAQHIKNPATKQTRAIRSLPAPQRLALTGTPVENRLSELWSIMDFCNPGLLGTQTEFREAFAVPIERLQDDEAAARLRRITRPFVLRRRKTDTSIISDLPDKIEFDETCQLTREQGSLYAGVVEDMLQRIEESEGIERRGLVLQTMLQLKQVCNHPAHLLGDGSRLPGRSGKLARLEEVVDEAVDAGEKTLVFTQFAAWGDRLQTHIRERLGAEVLFLHGGVAKSARDRLVAAFQSPAGPSVFVLSLKAGGVGLNLTAANHVVHYDRWWNPAVEDQATDRAFRIGQHRDVVVRKLVCAGTLEERIAALIERKKDLAERVVGSGEGWLTELSTDELREVVALGSDAVA